MKFRKVPPSAELGGTWKPGPGSRRSGDKRKWGSKSNAEMREKEREGGKEKGARVNEAFSSLPLPFSAAKNPFTKDSNPGKTFFAKYYFIQIKGKYVTENELQS